MASLVLCLTILYVFIIIMDSLPQFLVSPRSNRYGTQHCSIEYRKATDHTLLAAKTLTYKRYITDLIKGLCWAYLPMRPPSGMQSVLYMCSGVWHLVLLIYSVNAKQIMPCHAHLLLRLSQQSWFNILWEAKSYQRWYVNTQHCSQPIRSHGLASCHDYWPRLIAWLSVAICCHTTGICR